MAGVCLVSLASKQQVDRGPVKILVERLPLIKREVVRILNVGHELGALGVHDRLKLACDTVDASFDLADPREKISWMEFAFCQFGKMKIRRRAVERSGSPQNIVPKPFNAFALERFGTTFALGHG